MHIRFVGCNIVTSRIVNSQKVRGGLGGSLAWWSDYTSQVRSCGVKEALKRTNWQPHTPPLYLCSSCFLKVSLMCLPGNEMVVCHWPECWMSGGCQSWLEISDHKVTLHLLPISPEFCLTGVWWHQTSRSLAAQPSHWSKVVILVSDWLIMTP